MQTSNGTVIPDHVVRKVAERLEAGEDWQVVGTEELRQYIPEHDDDLSELNEVIEAAERLAEASEQTAKHPSI